MICPHCSRNLLRKERTNQRCTHCSREFLFDPKTNPLGLHDLRVRAVAEKLSGPEGLSFSTTQLWYAAARKKVTEPYKPLNGFGCILLLIGAPVTIVSGVLVGEGAAGFIGGALIYGLFAAVLTMLAGVYWRPRMRRKRRFGVPLPLGQFTGLVQRNWQRVYGKPLPRMVADPPLRVPMPEQPRGAIVCPDVSVLSCLLANGLPQRHGLLAVNTHRNVPPGLPAILLHDASVDGLMFAAAARAALHPAPVVDAGLTPRQVLAQEKILRLRGPEPPALGSVSFLPPPTPSSPPGTVPDQPPRPPDNRATAPTKTTEPAADLFVKHGLGPGEAQWLAEGWWAPIAAVPPKKLLAVVERALERFDPGQREAAAVGFLTWPGGPRGK